MAIVSSRVSVLSTATLIVDKSASVRSKTTAMVKNTGSSTIYLGGPAVTAAAGLALAAGEAICVEIDNNDVLYGITSSGTNIISVMVMS